jgi:hypothetical protein
VSQEEYLDKADACPLNPNGELLRGVKLEDKYALANAEENLAEENLKVPGIRFAEWGPRPAQDPRMQAARAKVFAAASGNHNRAPKSAANIPGASYPGNPLSGARLSACRRASARRFLVLVRCP